MTRDLQVMGGSDVTMAPQFGNKHRTVAIEPISIGMVHVDVWKDFKDEVSKVWMTHTDNDSTPSNCRLHWAKLEPQKYYCRRQNGRSY